MRRYLPHSHRCYVCGESNPKGLTIRLYAEGDEVGLDFTAGEEHVGYADRVHGGVIAALLDEALGWTVTMQIRRMTYTAELTVRYTSPVPVGVPLRLRARSTKVDPRLCKAEGEILVEGKVAARAEGRFVPLSVEETRTVDSYLVYEPDTLRLFENL